MHEGSGGGARIGNDQLYGDLGNDTFAFAPRFGIDVVMDFEGGSGASDVIQFDTDLFADYNAVLAAAQDIETDMRIQGPAGNDVWLIGVSLSSLHQDDFAFV